MKLKKKSIGDFEKFQLTGAHYIIGGGVGDDDPGPGDDKPTNPKPDNPNPGPIILSGPSWPSPKPGDKPKD